MADFYRYPYSRPGGRSRSYPGSDFLSSDLPSEVSPDWQLLVSPSYKNVDTDITLNSTTVSASYVMYADAATATAWTPTTGSGSFSATAATVAHYGPFVDEIAELASDRFVEAGSTFGDIADEDFVIEITGRTPFDATSSFYVGKFTGGVGWQLQFASGVPTFFIDDNTTEASDADASSSVAAGEWFHIMVICDRSSATGLRIYINGNMSATPADCSAVGSITNAGSMFIGNTSRDFAIGHVAIWKQASWLNGSSYESVVDQRFQQIQGWYNASSTATVTPGNLHAVSDSYDSTTGIRRVVKVGANWIPCRISAGLAYSWAQPAIRYTNDHDPTNMDDAALAKDPDVTISLNAIASPLGTQDADGIVVADPPTGAAFLSDTTQSFMGGYGNTVQFFAKAGASNYVWVAFEPGAGYVTQHAIINLTNGTVERTHANRVWRTESWGNGWYRCIGWGYTASNPSLYIGPCDSATTYSTISGGAAARIYLWGLNLFRGPISVNQQPTDVPPVFASAGTRTADTLTFDVSSADPMGDGIGTIAIDYKRYDTTITLTDTPFKIEDASATGHNITMTQNTNGTATFAIADGVGTAGSLATTTALNDLTERTLQCATSTTTGAALDVAGTEEATDTYTASPADLDKVYLGIGVQNVRLYRGKL